MLLTMTCLPLLGEVTDIARIKKLATFSGRRLSIKEEENDNLWMNVMVHNISGVMKPPFDLSIEGLRSKVIAVLGFEHSLSNASVSEHESSPVYSVYVHVYILTPLKFKHNSSADLKRREHLAKTLKVLISFDKDLLGIDSSN